MENILSVLVFFPLVAAILGFLVGKKSIRVYGISVATIEFLLTPWLWFAFDNSNGGFQFIEYIPLVSEFGINYYLGVDGISLFIVIMAALMTLVGIIALNVMKALKNMIITLLFLEVAMIGVFVSLDAIVFYLFWEFSLVPMLYIIGAWGGELRLYAAIKFFLYTFAGSLVMLVGMLYMAYVYHSVSGVEFRHNRLVCSRSTSLYPEVALLGLFSRFRNQGSHVSFPYMASICAWTGTYCRFGNSCRSTFEDG